MTVLSLSGTRVCRSLANGIATGFLLIVTACSIEQATVLDPMPKPDAVQQLYDIVWQVEDVDNGGIIDGSYITLEMTVDGRISGSTGCNRYFGSFNTEAEAFKVERVGSTRKACVPAIMQQEQRFLQALDEVRQYQLKEGLLSLHDAAGKLRISSIRTQEAGSTESE